MLPLTDEEVNAEQRFWMNERNLLFLNAEIPAERGIPRFEVTFGIDGNKMLTITASDLLSGQQILENHPVVRLV